MTTVVQPLVPEAAPLQVVLEAVALLLKEALATVNDAAVVLLLKPEEGQVKLNDAELIVV